ncbi:hypothetical protein [Sutcliffiella rhizosphaerae]|uniref:Uncharacterized protein n=1 Tax=Sutcliffiella rhizosphaerae TaxID=2880967 RepID=A0ABN8AE89_9BACI|nr:hypothetical protein [Sutcliffiella rhizosphaerae]CAG9622386.1 hypothetical protein BACCIP111883_03177 [Sutcliffiella rhizosphaerae]
MSDKKLKVADIPILKQQKEYIPKGFVDLGLAWYSEDHVVVSRAKENKQCHEGPVPTMYTSLFMTNIITEKQTQIAFPKKEPVEIFG